jgi:chemotaxis response regulator CheB
MLEAYPGIAKRVPWMPLMDGAQATRIIMKQSPCAILVVTATVSGNADKVFQALSWGALDAVAALSHLPPAQTVPPLLAALADSDAQVAVGGQADPVARLARRRSVEGERVPLELAELEAVLTRTIALCDVRPIDADDLLFGFGRVVPRTTGAGRSRATGAGAGGYDADGRPGDQ